MKSPCVAVLACGDLQSNTVIDLLTQNANVEVINQDSNVSHLWNVDTKYYTAKVSICPVQNDSTKWQDLIEVVEAVIIYFNNNSENGLNDVEKWNAFVEDCQPDVKLLVTENFNEETSKISKLRSIEWCLKNGFELVELNPTSEDEEIIDEEEDSIFKETVGIERVVEALKAHLWSNMVVKVKSNSTNDGQHSNVDTMLDNLFLDDENLEFSDLFQKLHSLKESVQSMPLQDRKQCAEQVVAAFWRAIGGDEDEIEDIG